MKIELTVPYNGDNVIVVVEDDIAFGKIKDILKTLTENMVNENDKGAMVTAMINLSQQLMEKVVISAPWPLDTGWPDLLGIKTNKAILQELSKIYPLEDLFTGIVDSTSGLSP